MSFLLTFLLFLIIIFGVFGLIIYPTIALESDTPAINFIPIGLAAIGSAFLAYDYVESDGAVYNLDENTGILTVDVHDSEKKINEVQINYVTTKKEWKFF